MLLSAPKEHTLGLRSTRLDLKTVLAASCPQTTASGTACRCAPRTSEAGTAAAVQDSVEATVVTATEVDSGEAASVVGLEMEKEAAVEEAAWGETAAKEAASAATLKTPPLYWKCQSSTAPWLPEGECLG